MGFGERLQREREMRGITLEEIAKATKIGTRSLRALEKEEFNKLPGGIFNKGFVRAYAKYLGIDEEEAVADYMASLDEPGEVTGSADVECFKKIEANWKPAPSEENAEVTNLRIPWRGLAVLIVLILAGLAAWRFGPEGLRRFHEWRAGRHQQTAPKPEAVQQTTATTAAPAVSQSPAVAPEVPADSGAKTDSSAPAAKANPSEFTLHLRTTETCWILVIADGRKLLEATLPPNTEKSFQAKSRINFKAGAAGRVNVSFNGAPVTLPGNPERFVKVEFTPEGMQIPAAAPRTTE